MVFYGLGILASLISLSYHWKKKSRPMVITFFLIALFSIGIGFLQGNTDIIRRLVISLAQYMFVIAPYALGVMSLLILVYTFIRLINRGLSRKYAVLLFASLAMLSVIGLVYLNRTWWKLPFFYIISFFLDYFFLYLVITFMLFLSLVWMQSLFRPSLSKAYMIVLGMGLRPDDSLNDLLKYRLDAALHFYQQQKNKGEIPAKIIVSGGNNPDQSRSEAAVMRDYLLEQGVGSENILVEDQSINTHQNFLFSKRVMKHESANRGTIYITNNFHVFRSGLYARQLGIKAEGLGAKTPLYYLPYALFREYLALFLIFRYAHIIGVGLFLALSFKLFR